MSNLKALKREIGSSGSNNKLRSEGYIPAILYGGKNNNKIEVLSITSLMSEAIKRIANSNSVSDLFN